MRFGCETGGVKRVLLLVGAILLAGCSATTTAPVATPTPCNAGPPGTREVSVGSRSFLMHVPSGVRAEVPVVFTFHGRGSNAEQQLLLTGMQQQADLNQFIVVAPDARNGRWDLENGADDSYLQKVYEAVPCMDPTRVYASGMSMGSGMVFYLACQPERKFAAFGGVALTAYSANCDQAPPAPIIFFHGTKDEVVPFRGGQPQGEDVVLPPVPEAMQDWADHNGCQTEQASKEGRDVVLTTWSTCEQDADVDFYKVRGGGHTWPGTAPLIADAIEESLGRTTQTVDASALMWQFFQQYQLA